MLNRSVSPGDLTHHHQSRYPKSRRFGYLPDLPSDVIACMSPVMLNPSPHRISLLKNSNPWPPQQVPKKSTFWVPPRFTIPDLLHRFTIGRQLLPAGRCPWSRIQSSATSVGARTCAEKIGFSRRPNPLPPKQRPNSRLGARTCVESIGFSR